MCNHRLKVLRVIVALIILLFSFTTLTAKDVFVRINSDEYQNASLKIRNELEIIGEENGVMLARCPLSAMNIFDNEQFGYETIQSNDHLRREDLPPMPNGGIPLAVVVKKGNQGLAGWHEGVALAGHVLAYIENNVDGQLPGFTFWDMKKDSVWHHYIDTDLDGDDALFMAASDNKIYYTFHYMNPAISNSDMRYYWYDVTNDEHGEVENFGYGYEGFGVSDTWMMRVGNKGMGWNNQIFAHNVETGERFELLADSTLGSWGYNYDNFGGPKTDGNTVVFTYIDNATYTPDLMVYSLGADGEYGTADDIGGTICSTATSYDQYRVDGRYIVWTERTPADEGNVKAYDMGEDELYGTEDDGGTIDICTNAAKQTTVRIDDNIIVWEDWRNATSGERDIYGYDLNTGTEFRSTASADSLMMTDIVGDEVVMIKPDWDGPSGYNDIYLMNITGRIESDYYRIDVLNLGEPVAQSLLTGETDISPYYFNSVSTAAKGPLSAVFTMTISGVKRVLAYSAITGDWSSDELYYSDKFASYINKENAMILGKGALNDGGTQYSAWLFNGQTGDFAPRETILQPDGFAVGKNISFIWGTYATTHWIRTYDAKRNDWYHRDAITNDPWHMITTDISDSLGVILYGQGDTLCDHIGLEAYDLNLHDWVTTTPSMFKIYQVNRQTFDKTLYFSSSPHFAAVSQDKDDLYGDYVYTIGVGDGEWKTHEMPYNPTLKKPLVGDNFLVQGSRYNDFWYGHIYDNCTRTWLPETIESRDGIDNIMIFKDLMMAWINQDTTFTHYAKVWAYSPNSDGMQELYIQNPGDFFAVKASDELGLAFSTSNDYYSYQVNAFNAEKGEWIAPLNVARSSIFNMEVSGHTGIFLQQDGTVNGTPSFTAYAYSSLADQWDEHKFKSSNVSGIFAADLCGALIYDNTIYGVRYVHAFNGIDGEWSEDVISMYPSRLSGLRLDDRIMAVTENGGIGSGFVKAYMYTPVLDLWSSTTFDNSYELEGYMTTPTSVFAWDDKQFKIIFNTQTDWNSKTGRLDELNVTDYAIAATLYNSSVTTTYYFYPPESEVITDFKFTEEPTVDVKSSWTAEIKWKTNKYSDTRLVWGVDGYYEIIEQDTLEPTKDHRVTIDGLEANKTYYYGAISLIPGMDTLYSDTLDFNTGADNTAPVLTGGPTPFRIHDNEAGVWWETDEPSTPIIQWGLTTDYTDTLAFPEAEPDLINAIRLYDLEKDNTYHYRVGGYDRYGNGPFYSGDLTFTTHNDLPVVTDLQQADSTLYGAAYMTWEPPRLDSSFSREKFTHGIPVDWKTYNRGDSQKGNTWTSGYIGDNPVAYCPYGESGEHQVEWLISNPITIDGTTGGVLNFWHMGFYNDYDNAPNKVMVSWTGTDPSDFTTVWSSQSLPDNWSLVQINLNYSSNYGKTMYIAFVYESTYGETWAIDDIYMDFTLDGYYENFNDLTGWTRYGGHWGLYDIGGNYALGVEGIKQSTSLPDPVETWDAWEISPFIQITNSHHILGFWQYGYPIDDTRPNEIRVVHSTYSYEASSEVVRTVYPVPNGWQWTTVDLSNYIGQTVMIGFRYNSNVGWWWNGVEWTAFWGEDWYIDDLYLFENAPEMVEDPNAKPNEKPLKFASSPNGKPIDMSQFKSISRVQAVSENLGIVAPDGSIDLPKEKPLAAVKLPKVNSTPAPSLLAEQKPELYGYEVYGRYPWETYYTYLGYVTSPSFVDWGTYLGYECEYYVEAVYDQGNSQPSNKAMIKGGTGYAVNEYGYDTGILYYSYWWYPGTGFANEFVFDQDSVLNVEKIKVHIAKPGNFKISVTFFDYDVYYTGTTSTINASQEGWYLVDPPVPTGFDNISSNYIYVEFQPQDSLVQLSYDNFDCGYSWFFNGSQTTAADVTFYIRLIGEKEESPYIAVADIPEKFNLAQNYPNPFNPTTTIAFDIPEAADVDIRIYDIRGVLVKTLARDHREAGRYQMVWDAKTTNGTDVASGVYLIKMTAGDYTETKKMVLVR